MSAQPGEPQPAAASVARWQLWLLGAVLLCVYLGRLMWLMRLPDRGLIAFVPDDAFYYLRLGMNFVRLHRWTFDGAAPTTGFHLLWGYMTAALCAISPQIDWRTAVLLGGIFGSAALAGAAVLIASVLQRHFGWLALVATGGLFLTTAVLPLSTLAMETPLPILAAAAAAWLIDCPEPERPGRRLIACFLVGLFGTLGRSDYGLLPLMLLLSYGAASMLCRERLPQAIRAAMVFGGAFAGVLVVLAHCWFVSGHLTQSSAQQKLMWSAAVGHSFEFSADLLRFVEPVRLAEHWMLLHHHPTYRVTQLMILLLCVPPLAYAWPRRGSVRTAFPLISASVLTLLGYVVFYHWDSYSIQIWYTANILLPVAVLLVCDVWLLGRLLGPTAVALPVTLAVFGLFAAATPAWPDQERLLDAAIYLREHPPAGPVAAWNAGVLSVVSGNADLINLDGLVNDQIHPYAEQGRLAIYLQQRGVRTVVDYQNQFTSTIISGMPLEQVDRCFGPPQVLSFHHENGWGVWPSVVVLRPVLACAAGR